VAARGGDGAVREGRPHERLVRERAYHRRAGGERQPFDDPYRSEPVVFRRPIALLWCVLLALAGWIVFARTTISADPVAFLPRSATPKKQLMVDQLRDGVASRLVLFAIEGGDTPRLAAASRAFAKALQQTPHFSYVN